MRTISKRKIEAIVATLPHTMDTPKEHFLTNINQAKTYIHTMDFSQIKNKIIQKDPNVARVWLPDEVDEALLYYKNFLYLNKKYLPTYKIIPPSSEIDEIWHHHILDTRRYHRDCIAIFGYYFHHYPYFGMRSEVDKNNLVDTFAITQYLHCLEFGDYIYQCEHEKSN